MIPDTTLEWISCLWVCLCLPISKKNVAGILYFFLSLFLMSAWKICLQGNIWECSKIYAFPFSSDRPCLAILLVRVSFRWLLVFFFCFFALKQNYAHLDEIYFFHFGWNISSTLDEIFLPVDEIYGRGCWHTYLSFVLNDCFQFLPFHSSIHPETEWKVDISRTLLTTSYLYTVDMCIYKWSRFFWKWLWHESSEMRLARKFPLSPSTFFFYFICQIFCLQVYLLWNGSQ